MIKSFIIIFLLFFIYSFNIPVYSIDLSSKNFENYTLKISNKFSNTFCNTFKFGISREGALRFAIGETNKEFLNNKLNKFIDYELLSRNIISNIENKCHIEKLTADELIKLTFK